MRYTSSREVAAISSSSNSSTATGSSSGISPIAVSSTPSSTGDVHLKKDGTPDMRYTSSKVAAAELLATGTKSSTSSADEAVHLKKDGTPDMRYKSSKELQSSDSSTQLKTVMMSKLTLVEEKRYNDIPSDVPTKKDGSPDMRNAKAKEFVMQQAKASTHLPGWVPIKKDGSIDTTKALGRVFAEHFYKISSPPDREEYYNRMPDFDDFRQFAEQQWGTNVPPPAPHPLIEQHTVHTAIPLDSIRLIDYNSIAFETGKGSELGHGTFGVVLKAKWDGNPVAVKKLYLERLSRNDQKEFEKELKILAGLETHPNIVHLYGYCLEPPCIIMELISLGSLSFLLHYCVDRKVEAKMTDGRIKKQIIFGVADGMRQLHAAGIVHCDLKPQNVLVNDKYAAKITDFGMSHLRGKTSSQVASKKYDDDGEEYAMGGTAGYMAPELLDSKQPPEYSSDVYSFGILFNEVVSESEPFVDQYLNFAGRGPFGATNYAKQGGRPTVIKKTPKMVEELIRKCWADNPKARPTFEEIVKIIGKDEFKINNSFELK